MLRSKVSSDRLVKPWIELATPGLHGEWFIKYITAAQEIWNLILGITLKGKHLR